MSCFATFFRTCFHGKDTKIRHLNFGGLLGSRLRSLPFVTDAGIDGENVAIEDRCEACEEACTGRADVLSARRWDKRDENVFIGDGCEALS